jgi:hypothetical protein
MLVQNPSPKQARPEKVSGWGPGMKLPVFLKNISGFKKIKRPWAYHIILKEKT